MIGLILRIALGTLSIAFIAWWLYVTFLGLKVFFESKTTKNNKSKNNK